MNDSQFNSPILRAGQLANDKVSRPQSMERTLDLLAHKPRVFQFPNTSVGYLTLRPKDPQYDYLNFHTPKRFFPSIFDHEMFFRPDSTTQFLEAQGSVTIPGNQLVGLKIDELNQDTLKYLSRLPANALDALCLCGNSILTNELEFIENLNALRVLCLDNTNINDHSFEHIRVFPKLEKLTLHCHDSLSVSLQALKDLPNLQYFEFKWDFNDSYLFADEALEVLGTLENLKVILLNWCNVSDQGVAALANLKQLQSLSIDGCNYDLSDTCTESLKEIKSLSRLCLDSSDITDKSVENLAQLQNLTILDLSGTQVSKEAATWLYERLPHCLHLVWRLGTINRETAP